MTNLDIYGRSLEVSERAAKDVVGFAKYSTRPQNTIHFFSCCYYIPQFHCLYDTNGDVINESRLHRDRTDPSDVWPTNAPNRIQIPIDCLVEERATIFLSVLFPHYGHFLLEGLARLWASQELETLNPLLLYSQSHGECFESSKFFKDFFDAAGVTERLRFHKHPVMLKRALVPEASFYIPREGYSNHVFYPRQVAKKLLGRAPSIPLVNTPVYLSRTQLKQRIMGNDRIVTNELKFESELIRCGFHVFYTETMTLLEQIELFNKYRYFVGTRGSAFHNLIFCLNGTQQESFCFYEVEAPRIMSSYYLVDCMSGVQGHYLGALVRPTKSILDDEAPYANGEWVIDIKLAMEWLEKFGLLKMQPPSVDSTACPSITATLTAHISGVGDVRSEGIMIAGRRGSGQGIEGFRIEIDGFDLSDFTYRAMLNDGAWTPWSIPGGYVGTKGRGEVIKGCTIALSENMNELYRLDVAVCFSNIDKPVKVQSGENCLAADGEFIEAMEIRLSPKRLTP